MKVDVLVTDVRNRFCKKIIANVKTKEEEQFSEVIIRALNDNEVIREIYYKVPAPKRAALKARMSVITSRAYPEFLESTEKQLMLELKKNAICLAEKYAGKLGHNEKEFLNRI